MPPTPHGPVIWGVIYVVRGVKLIVASGRVRWASQSRRELTRTTPAARALRG